MVAVYCRETGNTEYTLHDIAVWAIRHRLWEPPHRNQADMLAKDLGQALRQTFIRDKQDRRVRLKHPVKQLVTDAQGLAKQEVFWADIRQASPAHMQASFQQRRHGILDDCKQLRNDVDSYNENFNPGALIQVEFNFEIDLEELDAAENG